MHEPDQSATNELGYANPAAGGLRGHAMRAVERLSGLDRIRPRYEIWRRDIAGRDARMFNIGLDMLGVTLRLDAPCWPPAIASGTPLVMVCNHPFGIGDGIAALALAEQLNRPFRALLNKEFLRVPEVRPYALPIDFDESREAVETNLRTRREAAALLRQGVTLVVFPAGAVATARWPWGRAHELPWKGFVAQLVQASGADVLPIWFEGRNSALFHAVSRMAPSLRMSMLVAEFRRFVGGEIKARAGAIAPHESLPSNDRRALLERLFVMTHRLAPDYRDAPDEKILALLNGLRHSRMPWDRPVARRRNG